jgi:hypothetical protein
MFKALLKALLSLFVKEATETAVKAAPEAFELVKDSLKKGRK